DGRAPPSGFGRRVREALDERRAGENLSDYLALDAYALAVNDANDVEAFAPSLAQVLLDDGAHLARRYRVQVEHVADFKTDGFGERVEQVNLVVSERLVGLNKRPGRFGLVVSIEGLSAVPFLVALRAASLSENLPE